MAATDEDQNEDQNEEEEEEEEPGGPGEYRHGQYGKRSTAHVMNNI